MSYLEKFRKAYWRFLATSMIRIILVIYRVWVLASLFQSQNGDSWGAKLLAGLTLGVFSLLIVFFTIRVILLARQARPLQGGMEELYTNRPWMRKYGVFYSEYKANSGGFSFQPLCFPSSSLFLLLLHSIMALLQAFGQLGCELLLFLLLLAGLPFDSKTSNILSCIIAVVGMIS